MIAPASHRPDRWVEVLWRDRGFLDELIERSEEILLHHLADPRRIDRNDVVVGDWLFRVLDDACVQIREPKQLEVGAGRHVVAKVGRLSQQHVVPRPLQDAYAPGSTRT